MDLISNGTPANLDGWTPFPTTWTYASTVTFTVAGDVTSIFGVGTKLKWTQSSTNYHGYVASSSYSSPNTTVTVAGDAVLNATITSARYSYASNPQGFPHWFSWTPTCTGCSTPPDCTGTRFTVSGRTVIMPVWMGNSVSNDTTFTIPLPIPCSSSCYNTYTHGNYVDNSAWALGKLGVAQVAAGVSTTHAHLFTADFGAWTNSGVKRWLGIIIWEI